MISRAWDFDSSRLAYQLTMIDRCLFMKIQDKELEAIMWQFCPKNAPNISAIIAFSHRINCLVTTEILREESLQVSKYYILLLIFVAFNAFCELFSSQLIFLFVDASKIDSEIY